MGKPYTHADAVRDLDPVQRARYDALVAGGSPAPLALEHSDHDHDDEGCVEAPSPQPNTQKVGLPPHGKSELLKYVTDHGLA